MIRDLPIILRSGGNSVVVVASTTAGGNSIFVAQFTGKNANTCVFIRDLVMIQPIIL